MALSNQALALISISTLLVSTFAVEVMAQQSPSPAPSLRSMRSYISTSPTSSPSPSPSPSENSNDEKADTIMYVKLYLEAISFKIQDFAKELNKSLDDPKTSSTTKECILKCNELCDAAYEDVFVCDDDLDRGDFYKANFDISSISNRIDTCEQCFGGGKPEVKKFDDWLRGAVDDCITKLNKFLS